MKLIPKEKFEYVTETKPEVAGTYFNADVLQESNQKIFVLRDNLTSYTDALLVKNETKQSLREALQIMTSKMRIDQPITIRVDSQSALKSLAKDKTLSEENIRIEVGSSKNKNKNAVAEKAIRELRQEIVKVNPSGGKVSEVNLAKAIRILNSRIRFSGCSSKELWMKRDQVSGQPLNFTDSQLSDSQYHMRVNSHESSAKYESRNAMDAELPTLKIGDRVYVKSDAAKNKARDPYVILKFVPNKNEAQIQKWSHKKTSKTCSMSKFRTCSR